MKFKMTAEHLYWWPVEVQQPSTDPKKAGQLETMAMNILFAAIDRDEAKAADEEIAKLPVAERAAREFEHLEKAIRGWDEVEDEDGHPVPFSLETFRQAMQRTWFRIAVYKAYAASLAGDEARRKN